MSIVIKRKYWIIIVFHFVFSSNNVCFYSNEKLSTWVVAIQQCIGCLWLCLITNSLISRKRKSFCDSVHGTQQFVNLTRIRFVFCVLEKLEYFQWKMIALKVSPSKMKLLEANKFGYVLLSLLTTTATITTFAMFPFCAFRFKYESKRVVIKVLRPFNRMVFSMGKALNVWYIGQNDGVEQWWSGVEKHLKKRTFTHTTASVQREIRKPQKKNR